MKRWKDLLPMLASLCLMAVLLLGGTAPAAAKEMPLVDKDFSGSLTVMFLYDSENVDITFVSPTGVRYALGDPAVEMEEGQLWRTYRVNSPEEGLWKAEYQLGSNEKIDFSIIRDDLGLWLQSVTAEPGTDGLTVRFRADTEREDIPYQVQLFACGGSDPEEALLLYSGSAMSGREETVHCDGSGLATGDYTLRADVVGEMDGAEVFDSLSSETFSFTNSKTPPAMDRVRICLDQGASQCRVDWEGLAGRGAENWRVTISDGGTEPVYRDVLESDTHSVTAVYPTAAEQLTVTVEQKAGGLWSAPLTRKLVLNELGELTLRGGDVTGQAQALVDYDLAGLHTVELFLDGEACGSREVSGQGYLSIPLHEDSNLVCARVELDELLWLEAEREIFLDSYPPEITLFDDLDGKYVTDSDLQMMGQVTDGAALTVNGQSAELGADGSFSLPVSLSLGENLLELRAVDANGNESLMVLTVICQSMGGEAVDEQATLGWERFLPLAAALLASALAVVMAAAFLGRRGAGRGGMGGLIALDVVALILELGCAVIYFLHVRYSNSLAFLDLAQSSTAEAIRFLHMQRGFGLAALAGAAVLALLVLITAIRAALRKRKGA